MKEIFKKKQMQDLTMNIRIVYSRNLSMQLNSGLFKLTAPGEEEGVSLFQSEQLKQSNNTSGIIFFGSCHPISFFGGKFHLSLLFPRNAKDHNRTLGVEET